MVGGAERNDIHDRYADSMTTIDALSMSLEVESGRMRSAGISERVDATECTFYHSIRDWD
jgi:hypothetical protein